MTASRPASPPFSADFPGETDLAKVDAHVVAAGEYDEIPELTDAWFEGADHLVGDRLVRRGRGRPKLEAPKRQVTLRLDADVVERLRASGPGWQSRANAALRQALGIG